MLGLWLLGPWISGQEIQTRTIPNTLLRPERGEAPRYPKDLVIGELGRGEASEEAYRFAGDILSALIAGSSDAPALAGTAALITEDLVEIIRGIEPRSYRLGGGRTEADGNISFLLRFFGSEESITGEMFIRLEEQKETVETNEAGKEKWVLDDFILEEKRMLQDIRDSYRYDFSPYERFF